MLGVAQRALLLAPPGEAAARCRGFQGKSAPQDADKDRLGSALPRAKDAIQEGETGPGREGSLGFAGGAIGEARPARKAEDFRGFWDAAWLRRLRAPRCSSRRRGEAFEV